MLLPSHDTHAAQSSLAFISRRECRPSDCTGLPLRTGKSPWQRLGSAGYWGRKYGTTKNNADVTTKGRPGSLNGPCTRPARLQHSREPPCLHCPGTVQWCSRQGRAKPEGLRWGLRHEQPQWIRPPRDSGWAQEARTRPSFSLQSADFPKATGAVSKSLGADKRKASCSAR